MTPSIPYSDAEDYLEHFGVKGMRWGVRSAQQQSSSGSRTRGEKAAASGNARTIAKADAKWEREASRSVKSLSASIKIHNAIGDKLNGPNGDIAKINNNPKFKNKDFTKDSPLRREYYATFEKVANRRLQEATREHFGTNASGSKRVESYYPPGSLLPAFRIVDNKSARHADDIIELSVKFVNGYIIGLNVEEALKHFGAKGMRWGVRSTSSTGKSNRQLNREARAADQKAVAGRVNEARAKWISGELKNKQRQAKEEYKKDKLELGSYRAKTILKSKKDKVYEEMKIAMTPKNGKEAVASILLGTVGNLAMAKLSNRG